MSGGHCNIHHSLHPHAGTLPALDTELSELLQVCSGASSGSGIDSGSDSWAPVEAVRCLAEFLTQLNAAVGPVGQQPGE